jgi:large subunit ribosomal protein L17
MRHLKTGRKLNRSNSHRKAMLRNLVTSLIEHEHVRTTDAKAKELRRVAERMITLGKRGSLAARRRAASYVRTRKAVQKLFDEVAARFRERPGGYTRIVKIGHRHGDAASMSVIELTDRGDSAKAEAERKKERRARRARKKEEAEQRPVTP